MSEGWTKVNKSGPLHQSKLLCMTVKTRHHSLAISSIYHQKGTQELNIPQDRIVYVLLMAFSCTVYTRYHKPFHTNVHRPCYITLMGKAFHHKFNKSANLLVQQSLENKASSTYTDKQVFSVCSNVLADKSLI